MNNTLIEWVKNPDGSQGYTWNPITGCLNGCPYCYARRLANGRLKPLYLANKNYPIYATGGMRIKLFTEPDIDPFYPRFWPERLEELHQVKAWTTNQGKTYTIRRFTSSSKGIFVCDMGELFGDWIPPEWQTEIFECIKANSQHRFYLLTKQPQNLIKLSPFPENCWVGVTATEQCQFVRAVSELRFIEATIKYLSFEPLLAHIPMLPEALTLAGINWLIIGAMTGSLEDIKKMLMEYPQLTLMPWGKRWTLQPKVEWVEEIIKVADKAGIPVFLKNNLHPFLGRQEGRQEMPK